MVMRTKTRTMALRSVDMVTPKVYIEKLREASSTNKAQHLKTMLQQWLSREEDSSIAFMKPLKNISEFYKIPMMDAMNKVVGPYMTQLAVDDLMDFVKEYGVKAHEARKADACSTLPVFIEETFKLSEEQDIYIVSTWEYIESVNRETDKKSEPTQDTLPEYSNPLAKMADESSGFEPYQTTD
jgi:hypothetical protein